jgi:hypothetical protein
MIHTLNVPYRVYSISGSFHTQYIPYTLHSISCMFHIRALRNNIYTEKETKNYTTINYTSSYITILLFTKIFQFMYLFNNTFRYTYNYLSTYFVTYITVHQSVSIHTLLYAETCRWILICDKTYITDAHFSVHCTTQNSHLPLFKNNYLLGT